MCYGTWQLLHVRHRKSVQARLTIDLYVDAYKYGPASTYIKAGFQCFINADHWHVQTEETHSFHCVKCQASCEGGAKETDVIIMRILQPAGFSAPTGNPRHRKTSYTWMQIYRKHFPDFSRRPMPIIQSYYETAAWITWLHGCGVQVKKMGFTDYMH